MWRPRDRGRRRAMRMQGGACWGRPTSSPGCSAVACESITGHWKRGCELVMTSSHPRDDDKPKKKPKNTRAGGHARQMKNEQTGAAKLNKLLKAEAAATLEMRLLPERPPMRVQVVLAKGRAKNTGHMTVRWQAKCPFANCAAHFLQANKLVDHAEESHRRGAADSSAPSTELSAADAARLEMELAWEEAERARLAAVAGPKAPAAVEAQLAAAAAPEEEKAPAAAEAEAALTPGQCATLLNQRGYVILPGAGLEQAARDLARKVRGYSTLTGVAKQPLQNGVALRRSVRLELAVRQQQQQSQSGRLREKRCAEVLALDKLVHEAAARALKGVQLDGVPTSAAALLVARAGAKQQGWHTDAGAADQTFSLLFPVDHREFCVQGLTEPLQLKPGDVLIFTGWLCHAGAQRLKAAGDGLCLHVYAGSGLIEEILSNVFSCSA